MDSSTLNVAAPVFQPGRFANGAKQTTPLSAASQGAALSDKNGSTVIQNQKALGSSAPGAVSMNANSRPFVPGGAANLNAFQPQRPQTPKTPYQADQSAIFPAARSPLPVHGLGHGLHPGSVQLTGLPAFLATPPIVGHMSPSPGYPGPTSPLSANGSASGSINPFFMPQGPVAFGLPRSAGPINGHMHFRKSRGLPPVTPLKTTGHNSTPSISLNPAAFAANLAALRAKKKVIVSLPRERPLLDDEALPAQDEHDQGKADTDGAGSHEAWSEANVAKLRRALTAASTRHNWPARQPWSSDRHDLIPCIDLPKDATVTCEIYPTPWPYSAGLPDTIEIYLPGASAWDEYYETAVEEQHIAPESDEHVAGSLLPRHWPWLPPNTAVPDVGGRARSMSISTPADPNMVTFKLNRYLQSQQESQQADPSGPFRKDATVAPHNAHRLFSRSQSDLTNRLRGAFERRRADSADLKLGSTSKRGQTMSLSMPSSGGPFGPEVFSALDLIRANSDEGPSKPASEAPHLPEKPSSDSEAIVGTSEPLLTNIAEDDAEQEAEAGPANRRFGAWTKTASGNWKALGRGFGYEPEPESAGKYARRHVRKTSRVSVSTSRQDGGELDEHLADNDEAIEIRTNPSEDADASDFEEELADFGPEHWRARRSSFHLSAFGGGARGRYGYEDEASDLSAEDELVDSLTPSDEQFSNPSDEEAARKERIMRRQIRAAERTSRREGKNRRRDRANTDNTLPSSSIGDGDVHERDLYSFKSETRHLLRRQEWQRSLQDEIISNPSDEDQSDLDDSRTFGQSERTHGTVDQGPRLSQDFRFPRSPKSAAVNLQGFTNHALAANRPPMSGTLGRASGISLLNPDAKEFKLGAATANKDASVPNSTLSAEHEATSGHFRLPSIKTSSFGSSALGERAANAPHLNVSAAAFTPSAFTFKTSQQIQVPDVSRSESPSIGAQEMERVAVAQQEQAQQREEQGREKRIRYGPLDYGSDDDRYAMYSTSPSRPQASTASIEGPLRAFSTLTRQGPPPFLPAGYSQQQRAVSHESGFAANAPSFVPSWAKGARPFSGSGSFKRPSLPDWGQLSQRDTAEVALPSIRDPSFFSRDVSSKAIPIRRPSEGNEVNPAVKTDSTQDKRAAADAVTAAPVSRQGEGSPDISTDADQTSNKTLKPPATFSSSAASVWSAQRARPIHIPVRPESYQSSSLLLASDASRSPSLRWAHRSAHSRSSMSSIGRRLRRPDGDGDDDESLNDFVDEIVDRVDKALEGWAGKILDEVTIMGQVRPNPRNGSSDPSFDHDKIAQTLLRRMEEVLDMHLASSFAVHARRPTDSSDGTQTTIRPLRQRDSSSSLAKATTASGLVDGSGEWDFDYVQEVLDAKLEGFRKHIETTMAHVLEKLGSSTPPVSASKPEPNGESRVGSASAANLTEVVSTRLMVQLESILEEYHEEAKEGWLASDTRLQTAMQTKLDENLFLLSEKGATERASIQQMLESELHGLERSIAQAGNSVQGHVESALKSCLPALLEEKMSGDVALANSLTDQVGKALGSILSDERTLLLEELGKSRSILFEALPSSHEVAQSTLNLVAPLVKSLKIDPIDSDSLVIRLAEVIGKQSIEHLVDLTPVLALLEPLIVKHEDARTFSKRILQRQEDTERTLSELPSAINAKTEIFLSSAGETSAKQALILEKVGQLKTDLQQRLDAASGVASNDIKALHKTLEHLSADKALTRDTAEKTLAELAGVYSVLNASYEALSRLETQQTSSEETQAQLMGRLEKQAQASADLARELREAESRAMYAEARRAELEVKLTASNKDSAMLRDQLAQMTSELSSLKEGQSQEREASAKALAEAAVKTERAEAATVELQDRLTHHLEQAATAEREAYDSAKSMLERASKAEGQVVALEKRIAEQDNRITNLQQLTATQKQKAAQSHQKLAEGEKRVKELEARVVELERAADRVEEMEAKAVELEDVRLKLKESEEREAGMREEVKRYDERWEQMERDLVEMKREYIERTDYEAKAQKFEESERLVEQLKAQLAAVSSTSNGWDSVSRTRTGAWSSMHAPRVRVEDVGAPAGRANGPTRSISSASTTSVVKEVEVDAGGWWS
ncbi:hypothetical protein PSEUBRA_002074 [Kalmanozyma brasiliensis GHG001]|uniref:Uncharacterized protein n=1 Tax=Kalmanozyma brasiliensis (strain GHG001) TaxID=1365824 RepID=V5EXP7_KALBG|nr:uncharacterized protein PSEUBRA_002074 [Kalmanozyma brasiliensis GHG001]EST08323.1 hypothetical protein PSEUBRA_002074 [Kalmanozyma brasiliensis GHG001]